MNMPNRAGTGTRGLCAVLLMGLALLPLAAMAGEARITASFRPSALDPGNVEFQNTSRPGIYCRWYPAHCAAARAYFVDVPIGLRKVYTKGGDVRERFYIKLPPQRIVTLRNTGTGKATTVNVEFIAVSGLLSPGGHDNPVFTTGVRGGCRYLYTSNVSGRSVVFGWTVVEPANPSACNAQGDGGAIGFTGEYSMQELGIGLRISTASPLGLEDGTYEGYVSYSLGGEEGDIDFGDGASVDPMLGLHFEFNVAHDFQVRFAADAPHVSLVADGGWSQWVHHGRPPARLREELPFHLTTSMDFSMKLRCEYVVGEGCGIRNAAADAIVPVDVDVTIPGMRSVRDGRPAQNTALLPDDARAPRFTPDGYLMQRRSTLRFTAGREAVTEMLKSPGSQWQGNMTVVFDANP